MSEKKEQEKRAMADRLLDLAKGVYLFHSPEKVPYAICEINGAKHCLKLHSETFKFHLARLFHEAEDGTVSTTALDAVVRQLAAKALFEGPEVPVFVRVAPCRGGVAVDLGDATRQAVLVTDKGYSVGEPQYPFRRGSAVATLPHPTDGGDLQELFLFLNIANDAGRRLILVWMLHIYILKIPYVVLDLEGPQGSAKSTSTRLLVSLLDPSQIPLLTLPASERDLLIAANQAWVLAFDNLRKLPPEVSDQLCRLATGGGLRTRRLYTDDEETILNATRPVIINGIHGLVREQDLLSRALVVTLSSFDGAGTRSERELTEAFEKARPRIFGALMSVLSGVLRELPGVQLTDAPRMADFARIGVAAERALGWPEGSFLEDYRQAMGRSVSASLENDPVAQALGDLVTREESWSGTTRGLLQRLVKLVPSDVQRGKEWPKSPNWLSSRLRRMAPGLLSLGVTIDFDLCVNGQKRVLRVSRADESVVTGPEVATEVQDFSVIASEKNLDNSDVLEATAANTANFSKKGEVDIRQFRIKR